MSSPTWNDIVMMLEAAVFELQAKFLFARPASPKQPDQRIFTPGPADAIVAVSARRSPHSRVTFFIATASETSGWGCGGGEAFQSRGYSRRRFPATQEREMGSGHVALPRDMTRHTT